MLTFASACFRKEWITSAYRTNSRVNLPAFAMYDPFFSYIGTLGSVDINNTSYFNCASVTLPNVTAVPHFDSYYTGAISCANATSAIYILLPPSAAEGQIMPFNNTISTPKLVSLGDQTTIGFSNCAMSYANLYAWIDGMQPLSNRGTLHFGGVNCTTEQIDILRELALAGNRYITGIAPNPFF